MPSFPFPVGGANAALAGTLAELDPRRQEEYIRLRAMRQAEMDAQATRELMPAALAHLLQTQGPQPADAGAVAPPGAPPVQDPMGEATLGMPQAGAPAAPVAAAGGAGAGLAEPASLASLSGAIGGPQNLALLMRTAEGANALNQFKPITPEESERRQRRAKAMKGYREAVTEMQDRMREGDAEAAQLAHIKALRAMLDGVDDPSKVQDKLTTEIKEWKRLRDDKQDREYADEDAKAFARARDDLIANPDDPVAFMGMTNAALNARSTHFKRRADVMLPELLKKEQERARESRFMADFDVINTDLMQRVDQARAKGAPANVERLWQDAVTAHPTESSRLRAAALLSKTTVPQIMWRALFPGIAQSEPKTELQAAMAAARSQGYAEDDPRHWTAVQNFMQGLHPDRNARADYLNTRAMIAKAKAEDAAGGLKAETGEHLTRMMKRQREVLNDTGATDEERQIAHDAIAQMQELLNRHLERQRTRPGAPAPGGAAPAPAPAPAPGEPPAAPGPPPPAAPAPASPPVVRTKRANIGGKNIEVSMPTGDAASEEYAQSAVAEAKRLMTTHGLKKAAAIKAMKSAGWDVQ